MLGCSPVVTIGGAPVVVGTATVGLASAAVTDGCAAIGRFSIADGSCTVAAVVVVGSSVATIATIAAIAAIVGLDLATVANLA